MLKLRQLGSGKYSDCFRVSDGHSRLALKISYYRDSTIETVTSLAEHGDLYAAYVAKDQDAVSVSAAIADVASTMREHRVTPHIVEVYAEADAKDLPSRLAPLLRTRLPTLSARQAKFSHICLMELCACTLASFVTRSSWATDRVMRCLIFQVLYTLVCLQQVLPGFRHNDLSTTNVLIRRLPHPQSTRYTYEGTSAVTADMPFAVALADFDFTHVPGHEVLANERILGKRYGIGQEPNEGYDTHVFLSTLKKAAASTSHLPHTNSFLKTLKFESTCRPKHRAAHLDPSMVLRHTYFDPLRGSGATVSAAYCLPT